MSDKTIETIYDDPRLKESLQNFQEEHWESGLKKLDELISQYPFDPDIRALRTQAQIKSRIDDYEQEEIEAERKAQLRRIATRVGIGLIFFVMIILASTTYAGAINNFVGNQADAVNQRLERIELAIQFRSGQNLLQAGRAEQALELFEDIRTREPQYQEVTELENLDLFIEEAQEQLSLAGKYEDAVQLVQDEEWEEALALLTEINEADSTYLDVPLLIEQARRNIALAEQFELANEAYNAENWSNAVDRYETIRLSDVTYERDTVEERLFNSYINAAQSVLDNPEAEAAELEVASGYFERALALRPRDQDVLRIWTRAQESIRGRIIDRLLREAEAALVNQEDSVAALEIAQYYFNQARKLDPQNEQVALQAELARRYLQAINDFRSSIWEPVITNLEYVYALDPEYAAGTARQTLYDVYILRGDSYLIIGDNELALQDYRRAVEIAQDNPGENSLSVYEAQLKIAFTLGALFEYESSVQMYQNAIETGDLRERAAGSDPALLSSIQAADSLAIQANYRLAYLRYRDLFNQNDLVYTEFVTHFVQENEYLSQIARLYGSSIQAIVTANDITDPNRIVVGQELIIPVFESENP